MSGLLRRYTVVVSGHASKTTVTRRGAQRWADLARDNGLDATAERTRIHPACGLHACPGGSDCPEAGR